MWEGNRIQMKQIFIQFIDKIHFKIVHQTHIENEFGPEDPIIEEFFLRSNGYPEVFDDGLFVLGNDKGRDETLLIVKNERWKKKLFEAVNKYNEIHK